MRRLTSLIAGSSLLISQALPCCWASKGPPVWMTNEAAIIVWDSAKKVQHFIREASFDTQAKDFGFIVPLPSVPDFAVADRNAFSRLESLKPVPASADAIPAAGTSNAAGGSVEILKEERVGDYQATVLRATDAEAMSDWLQKNQFKSRPQMTEWLGYYTKKGWVFAALKYVATPETTTHTKAVRISFKTDQPHYPYKMPSDAFKPGWVRPLKLYFVADSRIKAKLADGGSQWSGREVWSGALPEGQYADFARELALQPSDLPASATVTIFENGEDESKYDEDLVFVAATNWSLIWGTVILLAICGWLLTQRNRRKFVPNPA